MDKAEIFARRPDFAVICELVGENCKVLEIGCGDGSLLALLRKEKGVKANGIELTQEGVNACVRKGLTVIQGDADLDLDSYVDGVFDYAILSHTILSVKSPVTVLRRLVSIASKAIVSTQNVGHARRREHFQRTGELDESPFSDAMSSRFMRHASYEQFRRLCTSNQIRIEAEIGLDETGQRIADRDDFNLQADQVVFLLSSG